MKSTKIKSVFRKHIASVLLRMKVDEMLHFITDNNMLILNYHGVGDIADKHYMPPDQFKKHLDYFRRNFNVVPMGELFSVYLDKAKYGIKTIALTFDDGDATCLDIAEMLQGLPATFFVTGLSTSNNRESLYDIPLMTKDELIELSKLPNVKIGCHSMIHWDYMKLPLDFVMRDMKLSKKLIEEVIGKNIYSIAYPFGSYDEEIKDLASECGFLSQLTVDYQCPGDYKDLRILPRHGIPNTTTYESNILQICHAFKKVKS